MLINRLVVVGGVAQVFKHLPNKHEAEHSNPSITRKKKKKKVSLKRSSFLLTQCSLWTLNSDFIPFCSKTCNVTPLPEG